MSGWSFLYGKKILSLLLAFALWPLCGCAREKQVTSLCVPGGEQAVSSNEEAAPEANGKTTQETENGQTRHLEYGRYFRQLSARTPPRARRPGVWLSV